MAKYVNDTVAQKIANDIQKNRVNLGAFDTVDTSNANYNLISRNTWVVDLGTLNFGYSDTYQFFYVSIQSIKPTLAGGSVGVVCSLYKYKGFSFDSGMANVQNLECYTDDVYLKFKNTSYTDANAFKASVQGVFLQYELADNLKYTEKVIKGVPIHTLDQNGEEWLRSEWEKGLNLFSAGTITVVANNEEWKAIPVVITLKPNTKYTIQFKINRTSDAVCYLSIYDGTSDIAQISDANAHTFTTTNATSYTFYFHATRATASGTSVYSDIMLVEGDHPYPYQPYSGAIVHEKDIENVAKTNLNNNFSVSQTIADNVQDCPLELSASHSDKRTYIKFTNTNSGYYGYFGLDDNRGLEWASGGTLRKVLFEDDIAELKALVYDNQYPAIESVDTTYSFNYTLPSSLNSNLTIFGAGMDISCVKGRSYVYNQLVSNGTFADTTGWTTIGVSISASNNVLTITTNGNDYARAYTQVPIIETHQYLSIFSARSDTETSIMISGGGSWSFETISSSWQKFFVVKTASTTTTDDLVFGFGSEGESGESVQIKEVSFIDLTQFFNGAIPSDLLSNPSLFLTKYYNGSLDYDTGTLIDSKLVSITSKGMNIWDEEVQVGVYIFTKRQSPVKSCL